MPMTLLPQSAGVTKACRLVVYEDVGMEGSALFVYDWVSAWLVEATEGRVQLESVECRENDKNSATYAPR